MPVKRRNGLRRDDRREAFAWCFRAVWRRAVLPMSGTGLRPLHKRRIAARAGKYPDLAACRFAGVEFGPARRYVSRRIARVLI